VHNTEPDSRVGSRFGPYQLMRLLGRGRTGEVYQAEDTRNQQIVALKLIFEQFSGNAVFRSRMQHETEAAGRLTEPHVVPIHAYGEIDGVVYVEMRLIDGTDLATLLKCSEPLSPARSVAIVGQIASALDTAHSAGVLHRDVKPENILVTDDDFAYLVDFGTAHAAGDPGLTHVGTSVGTYNYMAPERFTGADVTDRSDVYSLACVLAECLAGSPPHGTDSVEQVVDGHLTAPAPRPSQLRPDDVSASLDEVIARGMAKKPGDRYHSAGDLALDARQALVEPEQNQATTIPGQDETASPPAASAGNPQAVARARQLDFSPPPHIPGMSEPWHRRKPILVGAVALVVAVLIAAVGYLVAGPSHGSAVTAPEQTELAFTGLDYRLSPGGVALDTDGNLYISIQNMYGKVLKLPAGSSRPTELPFSGLNRPRGVAVDGTGTVYVSDSDNQVVKLAAGSDNQEVLPFTNLNRPEGVAVDAGGTVYVADRGNDRVVKLAVGADSETVLPFDGLSHPDGVAVDNLGNVYVTDTDNNRVLKLPNWSSDQIVLPFTGIAAPWGIAVDDDGSVYVTEHDKNKVVKLAAGSVIPAVLPFTGLNTPLGVAVDKNGNVYVADRGGERVVTLAAG
jgi:serine/threonine-protein kinase